MTALREHRHCVAGSRRLSWAGVVLGAAAAVPTALGPSYVTTGKLALRDRMLDAVS